MRRRVNEPDAMDVESRNFKSYQQVPKWWSYFMTAGVIGALVVAIIALAVGSAALSEANSHEEVTVIREAAESVQVPTTQRESAARNQADTTGDALDDDDTVGDPLDDDDTMGAMPEDTQEDTSEPAEMEEEMMQQSNRSLPGSGNYTGFMHQPRPRSGQYFDIVTHGHASNNFYALLQKGIDDAAQALNVDVLYLDVEDPDVVSHTAIVENIVNARRSLKNGLAVSFPESHPDLVSALTEAAYDMPVLSILLDEQFYEDSGVETFANLGFRNQAAGGGAARRFNEAGVTSTLCLVDTLSVFGSNEACDALEENLEGVNTLTVDSASPGLIQDRVETEVTENGIDSILAIGADTFEAVYSYLEDNELLCSEERNVNNSDCVLLGTFDESDRALQGIVDGSVAFVADCQQYLQGYLSVLFLFIRSAFQGIPGAGRTVLTGPVFIDSVADAERRLMRNIMEGGTIENKTIDDIDVRFIVHGKTSDPFWNLVKNGVRFASRETGLRIDFRHPDSSLTTMDEIVDSHVQMILEASDDNVEALILTLPTNDTRLIEAIEQAETLTGMSIFTINSGHRWFTQLPLRAHIGLAEVLEGREVAQRLRDAGVRRRVLCVIHENGNLDLEERCESIRLNDTNIEPVILDSFNDREFHADMRNRVNTIRDAVIDAIENDADIQAVVSTGLLGTEPVRLALASLDRFCRGNDRPRNNNEDSCIEFAAYDVGPEVFTYIRNDEMLFAVDQQPGLQGFLPVFFAMIDVLYGNHPIFIVETGPRFVDMTNVEFEEIVYGAFANA